MDGDWNECKNVGACIMNIMIRGSIYVTHKALEPLSHLLTKTD